MQTVKVKLVLNAVAEIEIDAHDLNLKSSELREMDDTEIRQRVENFVKDCSENPETYAYKLPPVWIVEEIESYQTDY